ncbi:hypothetical protein KSF78_0000890 [Schistosoma japonicum]|nr:hypothetical protein KSF78_0000890 [Schistosoma japonicum]
MKSSNKFNVNTPKHIRHCQKLITCGKISNFTNYNPVLINHNVNMNNPSNITTTTTHPNKISQFKKLNMIKLIINNPKQNPIGELSIYQHGVM